MAYSHSFVPAFYYDPDAPFNRQRPTTVEHAVRAMSDEEWEDMVEDVFGPDADPDMVDVDMVMEKIYETNTVTDLEAPIEVWIDPEGYHTVFVYEG